MDCGVNLRIQREDTGVKLTASDYLDQSEPGRPLWKIADPNVYGRRLACCASTGDTEVAEAINVFDSYGYFRDRRRYLGKLIRDTRAVRAEAESPAHSDQCAAQIESYRSRIYQLQHWGNRVISKIQTKVGWEHDINGLSRQKGTLAGK